MKANSKNYHYHSLFVMFVWQFFLRTSIVFWFVILLRHMGFLFIYFFIFVYFYSVEKWNKVVNLDINKSCRMRVCVGVCVYLFV